MAEGPPQSALPAGGGSFWQLVHGAFQYRLPEAMIFVGREECDVTVQARSVDKRHAVIMYDYCDKKFKVKDLNSANGTFVNEVRIPVQTYIQLDSMDLLRFGFDSASYQVLRVPGPSELPPDVTTIVAAAPLADVPQQKPTERVQDAPPLPQEGAEKSDVVVTEAPPAGDNQPTSPLQRAPGTDNRPTSPVQRAPGTDNRPTSPLQRVPETGNRPNSPLQRAPGTGSRPTSPLRAVHSAPAGRESRAASEEAPVRPTSTAPVAVTRNLSAPPALTGATSISSLHSAFSEDSLLGDTARSAAIAVGGSPVTSPGARVPVDAVRTLGPCGPRVPLDIWTSSGATSRRTNTAPARSTPVRSSLRRAATALRPVVTKQEVAAAPPPAVVPEPPVVAPPPSIERVPPLVEPPATPSPSSSEETSAPTPGGSSTSSSSAPRLPPQPSPPLHPMAFTVDFANDGSKKLDIGDSISKFVPRHRRNLSVSRQEEAKQQRVEREVRSECREVEVARQSPGSSKTSPQSPQAPAAPSLPAPSPPAPCPAVLPLLRRAGYHSEGYFSSDQEDDLTTKSDLSVRKAKGLDKVTGRATNLAQEMRTKPEPRSPVDKTKRLTFVVERRAASLEESASQHFSRILGEQVTRQASCEPPVSPADNVSEAGTYTIDNPSPEESKARSEIDVVFGVEDSAACDTRTFTRSKAAQEPTTNGHEELTPKVASYRGGPNWIKEWAAQVAEQQNHLPPHPVETVLPPIVRGKGRVPSPCRVARTVSPLQSPTGRPPVVVGWPPPPSEPPPSSRGRHKLPSLTNSDVSDSADSPTAARRTERVERPVDVSLETESYLRATESVMSAMQARMTSHEAGGSSDGLGSQLRAKLRVLEQKSSPSAPVQQRRVGATAQVRVQREEGRQSDSSSEAGDHKPRSRERADSASSAQQPHTSLRRARLEADEAERSRAATKATAFRPPARGAPPPAAPSSAPRGRKLEPARPVNNSPAGKPPVPSATANFSRADGGRFSLRAGKVANQATPPAVPKARPASARKEPAKKVKSTGSSGSGGRSNSSLNSREVEFQNWKRRKSYDPMKAAAEGKKKAEAARKAVTNNVQNIMTQSAIVMASQGSPNSSPLNSILRSASFHGTGGMAGGSTSSRGSAATSEDEATLSADEELLEEASPHHLRARPSPLPPHTSPLPPHATPHPPHASPHRAISQPPEQNSHSRKSSLDETVDGGSRGAFLRNTTPTSSVRSRGSGKLEALDNLVIAAIHGFSNKIKGSSHNVLSKLRALFSEDPEKAALLEETLALLEEGEPATSSPSKSPSKELSGTLRNLKKLEHVFSVLDEVLFGEEDEDLEVEEELSDLEADQLAD